MDDILVVYLRDMAIILVAFCAVIGGLIAIARYLFRHVPHDPEDTTDRISGDW